MAARALFWILVVSAIVVYLMTSGVVPGKKTRRFVRRQGVVDYGVNMTISPLANGSVAAQGHPTAVVSGSLATLNETGSTAHKGLVSPRARLHLVYVYFAHSIPPAHYQWASMRISLQHGNAILLITWRGVVVPPDLSSRVTMFFAEELETEVLRHFRRKYAVTQGTTQKEPWERQNMERFFVLHEMMERQRISHVFYADSDVAITSALSLDALERAACDGMVSFKNDNNTFAEAVWVGWAGTAILTKELLKDFISYSVKLMEPEPFVLLRWKFKQKPYVCDMSIWYLFMVAHGVYSGMRLSEYWSVPPESYKRLPQPSSAWRFCDSVELGFDHMRGHRRSGFSFDRNTGRAFLNEKALLSIHFQGDSKGDVFKYASS